MTIRAATFIFITVLYLLTLRGQLGNPYPSEQLAKQTKPPFETSMERGRYAQVVSIAEDRTFNVDKFYTFLKPDVAWYGGHFYSTFPVGLVVLAVPFYIAGHFINMSQVFTYLVPLIFSLLTVLVIYKICEHLNLSETASILTVLIFSVGSVVWTYSVTMSAHPLSALLLALSFYYYLKIDSASLKSFAVLGLLYGVNLFVDYPNLVILLSIPAAAFIKVFLSYPKPRLLASAAAFLTAFVIPFALFVSFNLAHYQRPIAFTNTFTLKPYDIKDYSKLTNEIFNRSDYAHRFSFDTTLRGVLTLSVSQDRGLLFYFPVTILAIIGLVIMFKKRLMDALVFLAPILLALTVYGAYDDPWGGWAFGPRYLIIVLPLIAILCGTGYTFLTAKFPVFHYISVTLLGYSASIALLGALTTTAIPPSIETVGTNTPTNFIASYNYLQNSGVSSFVYKTLFPTLFSPQIYAYYLWIGLLLGIVYLTWRRPTT